jgi:hypothetical protein
MPLSAAYLTALLTMMGAGLTSYGAPRAVLRRLVRLGPLAAGARLAPIASVRRDRLTIQPDSALCWTDTPMPMRSGRTLPAQVAPS